MIPTIQVLLKVRTPLYEEFYTEFKTLCYRYDKYYSIKRHKITDVLCQVIFELKSRKLKQYVQELINLAFKYDTFYVFKNNVVLQ